MSGQAKQAPGQQQQRSPGPIHDPATRGSGGKPLMILGGVVLAGLLAWSAIPSGKTDPTPAGLEKVEVKPDDDRPSCIAFAPEKARMLIPGPESRIQYFGPGNRAGECPAGTTGFVPAGFAAKLDYKW